MSIKSNTILLRRFEFTGLLRISSDRNDRRIFRVWKFESRILASIFLGRLISAGTFLGIQNNERIRDSFRVSLDGIFGALNHGPGIF